MRPLAQAIVFVAGLAAGLYCYFRGDTDAAYAVGIATFIALIAMDEGVRS